MCVCVPGHESWCLCLQRLQALLDLHERLHGSGVGHHRQGLWVLHLQEHGGTINICTSSMILKNTGKCVCVCTCCKNTGSWCLNCSCNCGFPANRGLFISTWGKGREKEPENRKKGQDPVRDHLQNFYHHPYLTHTWNAQSYIYI